MPSTTYRHGFEAFNDNADDFWRRPMWTKPEFTEMRFGFEVTMYIYNR